MALVNWNCRWSESIVVCSVAKSRQKGNLTEGLPRQKTPRRLHYDGRPLVLQDRRIAPQNSGSLEFPLHSLHNGPELLSTREWQRGHPGTRPDDDFRVCGLAGDNE